MTEIERETILEDRRDNIQTYQNRKQLRALVAGQSSSYTSEPDIKPTRRQSQTGKTKQLDELKRRRKAKSEREEKRSRTRDQGDDSDEEKGARRSPTSREVTSEDDDGEYESSDEKKHGKNIKEIDKASHEDLLKIILRRGQLAMFWPTSFFSDFVTGAYVRQGVGLRDGQPEYRLAQIAGVAERKASRPYQLDKHRTDIMLTLQIGSLKKDFTIEQTSNSDITDVSVPRKVSISSHIGLYP